MKENIPIGIYIHIPFCKSKCNYCNFLSFSFKNIYYQEKYFEMLKKEIHNTILKLEKIYEIKNLKISKKLKLPLVVDTIYIGGGTPSLVKATYIKEILEAIKNEFKIMENAEITIEVNPESITEEKLKIYVENGINRVSVGLQTTNNNKLKQIGRLYTYSEFKEKYKLLKKYFTNINIDLMFGLPNQNIDDVKTDLQEIIKLNPPHISTYSLILEKNTKLYDEIKNYNLRLPEDTLNRDMYWLIKKQLEKNNFIHYEISNFSKKGMESKHNLNCWEQKEYLAYGIGASSYFNNIRFSNIQNLPLYIDNINNNIIDINIEEVQTKQDKEKEFIFLNLRKLQGLNINQFKEKFGTDPLIIFKTQIEKLIDANLIKFEYKDEKEKEKEKNNNNKNKTEIYINLTEKGLDLANLVWEEFI